MSKQLMLIVIGPKDKQTRIYRAVFPLGSIWKHYKDNKKAKASFDDTVEAVKLLIKQTGVQTSPARKDGYFEIQLQPGKAMLPGVSISEELQVLVNLFENLNSKPQVEAYIKKFHIEPDTQSAIISAANFLWKNRAESQ